MSHRENNSKVPFTSPEKCLCAVDLLSFFTGREGEKSGAWCRRGGSLNNTRGSNSNKYNESLSYCRCIDPAEAAVVCCFSRFFLLGFALLPFAPRREARLMIFPLIKAPKLCVQARIHTTLFPFSMFSA